MSWPAAGIDGSRVRFSIGYQPLPDGRAFAALVQSFRESVAEVYLAWPDEASGRSALTTAAQEQLAADLKALRGLGLKLNLLFNAACYGDQAMSPVLEQRVSAVLRAMDQVAGLPESVTTTSPAVAFVVKRAFPAVAVRASVNLRWSSIAAFRQMAQLFDSYCVCRDCNRDLNQIRKLKVWADANGKRLALLANSGCLRACAGQAFHDGLVAHEAGLAGTPVIAGFQPFTCLRHLADPANQQAILQATWIRPEDLHHYEGLVDQVKLATRLHPRPGQVLRAYAQGRFDGNLLDLFEPGLGPVLGGRILDNRRFPEDWFAHAVACAADGACDRCRHILAQVLVTP
jgi:hypothetical protein